MNSGVRPSWNFRPWTSVRTFVKNFNFRKELEVFPSFSFVAYYSDKVKRCAKAYKNNQRLVFFVFLYQEKRTNNCVLNFSPGRRTIVKKHFFLFASYYFFFRKKSSKKTRKWHAFILSNPKTWPFRWFLSNYLTVPKS